MIDHNQFPLATKLRIPRGGWPSHRSEYVIEGEQNRFGWCWDSYRVADGPPQQKGRPRRIFARVEGRRGSAIQLFEEMPDRPR